MDIEEAARRAVARVPRAGTFTTLLGRYLLASAPELVAFCDRSALP